MVVWSCVRMYKVLLYTSALAPIHDTQYVSWTMPSAGAIQMPTLVSRFHVVVWALHHIGHDSVSGSAMDILCSTHFDGFITCAF